MKHETYKGRKLKTVKGKEYGYVQASVNGVSLGRYQGTEEYALQQMRSTIDFVDTVEFGRFGAEWYAPGTCDVCEECTATMAVGGTCLSQWCMGLRHAEALEMNAAHVPVVEIDDAEIPAEVASAVKEIAHRYAGTGYVKDLMMGDVFRLPGNPHEVFGPVRSADSDYMLYGTNVDFGHGNKREWHAWTRIEHIKRGPKCDCGRFLELCENECPWPEEMEALFLAN